MEPQTSSADDASHPTEDTPLLTTSNTSPGPDSRPKSARTVTFHTNPVTRTFEPESHRSSSRQASGQLASTQLSTSAGSGPPVFSALNSKLRRRNSHGGVPSVSHFPLGPKIGPQRSTKKTEKLKLLPNPEVDEEGPDEESGRDVYSQYTRIKDPTARRDAARLGKADRDRLPRVTAYCTANRYAMDGLMRFLKGRGKSRGANPKLIDECIYSPYNYTKPGPQAQDRTQPVGLYERRHSPGRGTFEQGRQHREQMSDQIPEAHNDDRGDMDSRDHGEHNGSHLNTEDILGPGSIHDTSAADGIPDFDITIHTPEVFLFDYGVVVIWGMSEAQEKKFLKDISKFELEKLAPDDVETEHFNFYYTREYQARIYNDFITLRDKTNYMTKLAISHALAQSVKVSHYLTDVISSFCFNKLTSYTFLIDVPVRGTHRVNCGDLQGHTSPDRAHWQDRLESLAD
jgi:uncharacterized Rmd1/YagE family protein